MKRSFILFTLLPLLSLLAAQNTTRHRLRPAPATPAESSASSNEAATDTIVSPKAHLLELNGFDKPLRSRRETFFVTNNTPAKVTAVAFTMTYYDQSGRMLHSVPARVNIDIPAGETRQASIKSWDSQQAFYYIRSAVPARTAQATPFDVSIRIDTVFTAR
ncbi:MAG: FxLYD domain-containing protein [Muribaculaceae bacterium]|nr:FxLYD domain-containing protein [Muribaculaceae bacterium]